MQAKFSEGHEMADSFIFDVIIGEYCYFFQEGVVEKDESSSPRSSYFTCPKAFFIESSISGI